MRISGGSSSGPGRLPQLDGLRAVAVLAVLVQHGFPDTTALVQAFPWGAAGVRLFFVLSGFLITGILLECRVGVERGEASSGQVLRRFYARRALRIFPIYYGVLAVAALLDAPPVREAWLWLVTFTTNFYLAGLGHWSGLVNHLWTLAVEEQFYLVWPWVALFAPRRWLLAILLAAVAAAPLWRIAGLATGISAFAIEMVSLGAFDSLAMGALLAALRHEAFGGARAHARLRALCLFGGGPLLAAALALHAAGSAPGFRLVFSHLGMALFFTWIVDRAVDGFGGALGRCLEWEPLRYLGKISYGVYVYHLFVRGALWALVTQGILPPPPNLGVRFLQIAGVSIALAALSWHGFERPINDLKRHFPYLSKTTSGGTGGSSREDAARAPTA